jgi:hypothetical protein
MLCGRGEGERGGLEGKRGSLRVPAIDGLAEGVVNCVDLDLWF